MGRHGRTVQDVRVTSWIAPPAQRVSEPHTGDERAMLEGWLDLHRQTLLTKCAGLTHDQLAPLGELVLDQPTYGVHPHLELVLMHRHVRSLPAHHPCGAGISLPAGGRRGSGRPARQSGNGLGRDVVGRDDVDL